MSAGSVVAAGTLDLVGDPDRLDRREDWLLLRLDRCLGARFGYLDLDREADKSKPFRTSRHDALFSAGFPIDRSWRQLTVDPHCRVRATWGALRIHDCRSLPGNSGSPIFATTWRDGRAVVEVVAMHSTAAITNRTAPRGDGRGIATWMADVLPAIRAHLAGPSAPVVVTLAAIESIRRSPATASR